MTVPTLPAWTELLPAAKAKLLVDLTNALEAGANHLQVQERVSGPFVRVWQSITGEASRRSTKIASYQQSALSGVMVLVEDLCQSVTTSNHAITQAAVRLYEVELALEKTADVAADTRDQLRELTLRFRRETTRIDQEFARVNLRISAREHVELVMSRWSSGQWHPLHLAARCYASLADLYWGAFGDWCRQTPAAASDNLLEELVHRATAQMQKDAGVAPGERVPAQRWMSDDAGTPHDAQWREAIGFQGDWARPEDQPTVYVCSQLPPSTEWPLTVPRLCSAERLARAMVREVFRPAAAEVQR
jgi:hypothetical protein